MTLDENGKVVKQEVISRKLSCVLNIVHGGREVVDAICTHPGIAAVSFVGSSRIAKHVYALACSHGKRLQAAGGAKNVLLVMPDADLDSTLRAILGSSFGCAGQRCMAEFCTPSGHFVKSC